MAGMYDRRQTPAAASGSATKVHIEMYIRSFGSINPIQMDYTVDLYLRQRWLELRFRNNSLTRPLDVSDPYLVKALWKPEVYFPNAKESDFQYVTVPNVMLRIHPDGTILYILRLKLTFSCMMDLSSFPLDHQTCFMQVASFVKTTRELELAWYVNDPIKIYKRLKLPQFQMKSIKAETCGLSLHIGNYSCLQAVFELRRNVGYHLVQSYLPTSLIVVVSWVSFWLDVDAIPSRVTLGVTTLLTVCSESTSFRDKMPVVSYVKALDIWMGICTAFVFLALVEFTVVNHLSRHHRRFHFWKSNYVRLALSGRNINATPPADNKSPQYLQTRAQPTTYPITKSMSDLPRSHKHSLPLPDERGSSEEGMNMSKDISVDANVESIEEPHCVYEVLARNCVETPVDSRPQQLSSRLRGSANTGTYSTTSQTYHEDDYDLWEEENSSWKCFWNCDCTSGHSDDQVIEQSRTDMTTMLKQWDAEVILAKNIDKLSRAMFPFLFVFFNIIYWSYYKVFA